MLESLKDWIDSEIAKAEQFEELDEYSAGYLDGLLKVKSFIEES